MKPSQTFERICVWIPPSSLASGVVPTDAATINYRHQCEKVFKDWFHSHGLAAFVTQGACKISGLTIEISTSQPGVILPALKSMVANAQAAIGVWDEKAQLWRTFHPVTTRPFWTLLSDPQEIEQLLAAGRQTA